MTDTDRLVHECRQWLTWLQRRAAYQPAHLIALLERIITHLEASTCASTPDTTETPEQ